MTDASVAYRLTGRFFELCDCYTICPCWLGQPPAEGRCTGAFGWAIDEGSVDGQDVAGRRVVSVSFHTGHRESGGQQVYLFVDDGASDEQYALLTRLFTGQLGGPLGELGRLMGILLGTDRTPVELTTKGDFVTMTVGRAVAGAAQVLKGPDDEITELAHGRLAVVLGTPAQVGQSSRLRISVGGQGLDIEVTGRAAMRGTFSYQAESPTG
ncbi:MAG: DUF1326 domain-containing protein [Frankiaceae bacterium]